MCEFSSWLSVLDWNHDRWDVQYAVHLQAIRWKLLYWKQRVRILWPLVALLIRYLYSVIAPVVMKPCEGSKRELNKPKFVDPVRGRYWHDGCFPQIPDQHWTTNIIATKPVCLPVEAKGVFVHSQLPNIASRVVSLRNHFYFEFCACAWSSCYGTTKRPHWSVENLKFWWRVQSISCWPLVRADVFLRALAFSKNSTSSIVV